MFFFHELKGGGCDGVNVNKGVSYIARNMWLGKDVECTSEVNV